MQLTATPLAPASVDELVDLALARIGAEPSEVRVTGAWLTLQRSHHVGRHGGYRNTVVSLRVGRSVGSCYAEPGELEPAVIDNCIGQSLAELLRHSAPPVRIAALDAFLSEQFPHGACGAREVVIPSGTSAEKSVYRARTVVGLLGSVRGRVALIGVVNSLVQAIRERGCECLPCDLVATHTEWGEPVERDMHVVVERADAVVATGMTLANGSFDRLLEHVRARNLPLVVYAQSGSAIVPRFLGRGVSAVSAEPFPFFSMHGGPTPIYLYTAEAA
jgi:hypothetical protein